MQFEEFKDCLAWWKTRRMGNHAWKVPAAELLCHGCNLNARTPSQNDDIAHLPPEKLAESILKKEQKILTTVQAIQSLLRKPAV